jgi:membrane-associated protease RseP (regulator of RpoE activity)
MAGIGIFAFIVLMLYAIFFHELGHFVTARWAGIKVSKFFVGFGPTLWSTRRGRQEIVVGEDGTRITQPETEYGVKALPLGGFVKIVGMSAAEEIPPEDEPRAFGAAPAWKRAIVLVAGSVTHFITAFFVLVLIFTVIGVPGEPTLTIGAVQPRMDGEPSPAAKAGLEQGDKVLEVAGKPVRQWGEVGARIRGGEGRPLTMVVQKEGEARRTVKLNPRFGTTPDGKRTPLVGIEPESKIVREDPIGGTIAAGKTMNFLVTSFFQRVPQALKPSSLGLTGDGPTQDRPFSIVGAGKLAGDLASRGSLADFLGLFVQINIFIAIFNMLPLPPLDGGHLLVLGLEKIRGKPISPRAVMPVAVAVATLLLLLGVLLLYYDIVQPPQLPTR